MTASQPGLHCGSQPNDVPVEVPTGTRITVTCAATTQGVCFATPCRTDPRSADTGSDATDSNCEVVVTEPTVITCACAIATN